MDNKKDIVELMRMDKDDETADIDNIGRGLTKTTVSYDGLAMIDDGGVHNDENASQEELALDSDESDLPWYADDVEATNQCYPGETKVWTNEGPIRLDKLAEKDNDISVLTHDDEGHLHYKMMRNPQKNEYLNQIYTSIESRGGYSNGHVIDDEGRIIIYGYNGNGKGCITRVTIDPDLPIIDIDNEAMVIDGGCTAITKLILSKNEDTQNIICIGVDEENLSTIMRITDDLKLSQAVFVTDGNYDVTCLTEVDDNFLVGISQSDDDAHIVVLNKYDLFTKTAFVIKIAAPSVIIDMVDPSSSFTSSVTSILPYNDIIIILGTNTEYGSASVGHSFAIFTYVDLHDVRSLSIIGNNKPRTEIIDSTIENDKLTIIGICFDPNSTSPEIFTNIIDITNIMDVKEGDIIGVSDLPEQ